MSIEARQTSSAKTERIPMAAKKKVVSKAVIPGVKAPAKKGKSVSADRGVVKKSGPSTVQRRFWLTYPPKRIKTPVIWELGNRFEIMTNIRQASVTDELGLVCLEVEGSVEQVDAGLRWLKKLGLSVEPIELSTVAG